MAYAWGPLQALAPVRALNPGRYLVFVVLFASMAAGAGGALLARRRIYGWALVVLLVDLGPTTLVHGYISPETRDSISGVSALEGLREDIANLPPGGLPAYRLFSSTGGAHPQLAVGAAHVAGLPTFQSLHPGAVRASTDFGRQLEALLNQTLEPLGHPAELADHPLADVVAGGLGLFNVRYILVNRREDFFFSAKGLEHTPLLASGVALPYGGAAGASGRESDVAGLVRGMGIDVAASACRRLWVRGLEAAVEVSDAPRAALLEHRVWQQRALLRFSLDKPAFVPLAYAFYPGLEVRLNGERVEPLQTATRCLALRLPPGEHRVELAPRLSGWRRALFGLNALLLAAWLLARRRAAPR